MDFSLREKMIAILVLWLIKFLGRTLLVQDAELVKLRDHIWEAK